MPKRLVHKLALPASVSAAAAFTLFAVATAQQPPAAPAGSDPTVWVGSCDALRSLSLSDTSFTTEVVPAGGFVAPARTGGPRGQVQAAATGGRGGASPFMDLPAFCRVAGAIRNHPTSNIKFEVWLPMERPNQRFVQVGNASYAGFIQYNAMAARLREGYATASTDDGTSPSSDRSFIKDLQRVADFKGRAVALTTARAKTLFERFYSTAPLYSYFTGCSSGGLEALSVAQRQPGEFDGVTSGSAAFNSAGLFTQALWTYKYYQKLASKVDSIHKAVLAQCDVEGDGVADGVVGRPEQCRFDPGTMQCKAGDQPTCLTAEQVDAARKIYQGPVDPATGTKTGEAYAPGMLPGSELSWSGSEQQALDIAQPWYGEHLYGTPTFDVANFNFGTDVANVLARTKPYGAQVTNPDLSRFKRNGSKLLIWMGWNDELWSAGDIARYYKELIAREAVGAAPQKGGADGAIDRAALDRTKEYARLFLYPGMKHCGGGDGPNVADTFGAIVNWVERGEAPDVLIATKYRNNQRTDGVERTRPICTYPLVAKWKGTGDSNRAENFSCM